MVVMPARMRSLRLVSTACMLRLVYSRRRFLCRDLRLRVVGVALARVAAAREAVAGAAVGVAAARVAGGDQSERAREMTTALAVMAALAAMAAGPTKAMDV